MPSQQPAQEPVEEPNKEEEEFVYDPFVMEVVSIGNFKKFTPETVEFCKQLWAAKDKKLTNIYSAYQRTRDRDDFIHSVNRYYSVKNK